MTAHDANDERAWPERARLGWPRGGRARTGHVPAGAVLTTILVLVALVAGCSSSTKRATSGTTTPATSTSAGGNRCPTARSGPRPPADGWGIGRVKVTLTDHSRNTDADPKRHLTAHPGRTLPVVVTYPIAPKPGTDRGKPVESAKPAGSFPLVVFSHGITSDGKTISAVTTDLVRGGYVVAAPTFPLTSGKGAGISDFPNQPADVHYVVDHVAAAAQREVKPGSSPMVRSDCVAIAGHSLGAVTTLIAGYGSCCLWHGPTAPKAVISLSGVLLPFKAGIFDHPPKTPVLLIHGDADKTVPVSGSQNAFAKLPGPRWFLTLHGGGHRSVFLAPYRDTVNEAMRAFLDAELRHDPSGLQKLQADVARQPQLFNLQHAG